MKKIMGIIAVSCLVLVFFGCASSNSSAPPAPASKGMPKEVADLRRNVPEDTIVGVGSAKMANINQSRSIAATRARTEISNTLNVAVKNMVTDAWQSSEVDRDAALSYQESVTQTLSKSNLSGAVIKYEEPDDDGNWWVVMYLSKANLVKEINQAQAAARLKVPQMAAFDALERMDDALAKLKQEEGY